MIHWPWMSKQIDAPVSTSGTNPGCCERCNDYAMVVLNGQQWLCWNHYIEAMAPYREERATPSHGQPG
jgi:hypothetical protein